jgi:hypothetical protein
MWDFNLGAITSRSRGELTGSGIYHTTSVKHSTLSICVLKFAFKCVGRRACLRKTFNEVLRLNLACTGCQYTSSASAFFTIIIIIREVRVWRILLNPHPFQVEVRAQRHHSNPVNPAHLFSKVLRCGSLQVPGLRTDLFN